MSIALYRKYRPKTFDDIYGQSSIVQTLRNQIKYNKIAHAYLFCGLRGSGKTTIARILAKAINCKNAVDGNPCNNCECCNFQNDVNPDIIEIDAASNNGVDNIRQLIDEVNYLPTNTKYKVYIIDEIHMLSNSAFNALLKTIEEPPAHVIFILATTEINKVPVTIKSRCQIYYFKSINECDIVANLKYILSQENNSYFDDSCLKYIASKSEGSMRDAVNILDQCITNNNSQQATVDDLKLLFGDVNAEIIDKLSNSIEQSDSLSCINLLREQYYDGRSVKSIFSELYNYYFNKLTHDNSLIYERYMRILGETIGEFDKASNKMLLAEISIIKMCRPEMEKDYNSIVQRMDMLEKMILSMGTATENKKVFDENVILYYNDFCSHDIIIL